MATTPIAHDDHHESEPRIWPRFLAFPFLAVIGYVGFVLGWGGDSLFVRLAWSMVLGYLWFCVGASFHETVHQTLGTWRNANIWFGRILGTLLFIPYSAYRETHIRHHAYLNTADDWELWPYSKPRASLRFRRIFAWLDIFAAIVTGPIVYGRIYFKKPSPLSKQARKAITREYLGIIAFWGTALAALGILVATGYSGFDPMWLLPLPISSMFATLRKFTEHLGMASYDPFLGTRTVVGENWITRLSSYYNFELFVHGPHHRYPKAMHHQLPDKLTEYQSRNPEVHVPVFSSYRAAFLDMLPHLLKNPGVGINATGGVPKTKSSADSNVPETDRWAA